MNKSEFTKNSSYFAGVNDMKSLKKRYRDQLKYIILTTKTAILPFPNRFRKNMNPYPRNIRHKEVCKGYRSIVLEIFLHNPLTFPLVEALF